MFRKKNHLFVIIVIFLCAIVFLVACKRKPAVIKPDKKSDISSKIEVLIVDKGKVIKRLNVDKLSSIREDFKNIDRDYSKKKDFQGFFATKIKIVEDMFDKSLDNQTILNDIYGVSSVDVLNKKNKIVRINAKYIHKDYVYDFTYDGGVSLSRRKDRFKYDIIIDNIPSQIHEQNVVELGEELYMARKFKKNLVIPNTVKKIKKGAFAASSIEGIQLPKSLEFIGEYAFSGLWNRKETLGGVTGVEVYKVPGYNFYDNYKIIKDPYRLIFPEKLKVIDDMAFAYNHNIRELRFNFDNIEKVAGIVNMDNLDYIKLPSKITTMGYLSSIKKGLKNFVMPYHIGKLHDEKTNGVAPLNVGFMNNIGDCGEEYRFNLTIDQNFLPTNQFRGCDSLKSVHIKNGCREIIGLSGKNLEKLTIEEGIEYIGPRSFNNSKIKSVKFPKSLKCIDGAFNHTNLEKIEFNEGLEVIGASDIFLERPYKNEIRMYEITRPSTFEEKREIYEGVSFTNAKIKNLIFPNTIKNIIGFHSLTQLESLDLKGNIQKIVGFNDCALKSINLADAKIEELVGFNNCKNLKFFNPGIMIKHLEGFNNCKSLVNLDFKNTEINLLSGFNDNFNIVDLNLSPKTKHIINFFNNIDNFDTVVIKNSVETILGSFQNMITLKTLSLPNNVKAIDNSFNDLLSLKNLEIGSKLKHLSNSLYNTPELEKVSISNDNKIYKFENNILFDDLRKVVIKTDSLENTPYGFNKFMPRSVHGIANNITTFKFSDKIIPFTLNIGKSGIEIPSLTNEISYSRKISEDYYGKSTKSEKILQRQLLQEKYKNYYQSVNFINSSHKLFMIGMPISIFAYGAKNIELITAIDFNNINFYEAFPNVKSVRVPSYLSNDVVKGIISSSDLEEVILEKGRKTINLGTPRKQNKPPLMKLYLNHDIKYLDKYCFENTDWIKEIYIPKSLTKMGPSVFRGWNNNQTIFIEYKLEEVPVFKGDRLSEIHEDGWTDMDFRYGKAWNYKSNAIEKYGVIMNEK